MTRSPPPQQVPTLTDVVAWPDGAPATTQPHAGAAAAGSRIDPALRAEIEQLVDARLHAVLDAAWQQVLPALLDTSRRELASSLRDAVDRAVAERLSGHRGPG